MKKEFESVIKDFDLTKDELLKKADLVAAKYGELKAMEIKFEITKKSMKGTIDTLTEEVNTLLETIKTKKEKREIRCQVFKDYDLKVAQYFYDNPISKKTELVKERPLDRFELQMHLDDIKAKKDAAEIEKTIDEKIEKKLKDISATNDEMEVKTEPEKTEETQAQTETALSEPVEPENFDADTTQN
jgi:hypothetical protein